ALVMPLPFGGGAQDFLFVASEYTICIAALVGTGTGAAPFGFKGAGFDFPTEQNGTRTESAEANLWTRRSSFRHVQLLPSTAISRFSLFPRAFSENSG